MGQFIVAILSGLNNGVGACRAFLQWYVLCHVTIVRFSFLLVVALFIMWLHCN